MRRIFEAVQRRLRGFIDQRDHVALIVSCTDPDLPVLLKTLEGIDETSSSELFWIYASEFASAGDFVSQIVERFAAQHQGVALAMDSADEEAWPPIPAPVLDPTLPPVARLRALMEFSRSLRPGEDGLVVWALFPTAIRDRSAWSQLVSELLQHDFPFPWCHHTRILVRDDPENPALGDVALRVARVDACSPDLSPAAMEAALVDDVADADAPLEERVQGALILAAIDFAHRRYQGALEKYKLILPFYGKTRQGAQAGLVLNGMGECHAQLGDLAQAEFFFSAAIEPAAQDPPSLPVLLNVYLNLANLTLSQGRWAEAELYYDGAEKFATAQLNPRVKALALENRGVAQRELGKVEDATASWELAAEVSRKAGEADVLTSALERLRAHLSELGQFERARGVELELARLAAGSNTEQRLYRASDQQSNTLSETGKVATNWYDGLKKAIEGPPPSPTPLTTGQQIAQRVRQTQQIISSVMGLVSMGQDMLNVAFANLTAPIAALFPSLPSATMLTTFLGVPHAHAHPPSFVPPAPPVPLPSLGPVMLGTCVRVLINKQPAARAGDIGISLACGGFFPFFQIKTGSSNTFIGGNRAARMGDFCVVCTQASDDRQIEAGKFLGAIGSVANVAATGLQVASYVASGAAIVADLSEAAVEDDRAMAQAKALAAAMGAAQMAADLVAKALTKMMGKDPGIPPGAMGALLPGHFNVLIGGFPMINFPNPIEELLKKLKCYKARGAAGSKTQAGGGSCPVGGKK
jgi:tetratricopeptide (TPR) repeat protein/uncharacterized Zn-binding protein involved in type VI secretion